MFVIKVEFLVRGKAYDGWCRIISHIMRAIKCIYIEFHISAIYLMLLSWMNT